MESMQENYLAKLLNGDLNDEDLKEFKKSEEYPLYKRIVDATTDLEAPIFDSETAYSALRNRLELKDSKIV